MICHGKVLFHWGSWHGKWWRICQLWRFTVRDPRPPWIIQHGRVCILKGKDVFRTETYWTVNSFVNGTSIKIKKEYALLFLAMKLEMLKHQICTDCNAYSLHWPHTFLAKHANKHAVIIYASSLWEHVCLYVLPQVCAVNADLTPCNRCLFGVWTS